jgi:hypothetical protein
MISDRSGFRYPASEIVREWTGAMVAKHEEEPRHPQEFVRGVVDDYAVRNPRPRFSVEGLLSGSNTASGVLAIPDIALIDRDAELIVDRFGDPIWARGEPNWIGTFLTVDLGAQKDVSHVRVTIASFDEATSGLNLYTSEDNTVFTEEGPLQDAILGAIDLNEETRINIGRRCRYVRLGYRAETTISISYNITQFDIYGSDGNT